MLPAFRALSGKESVLYERGRHGFLQLCAAGTGPQGDHRRSGTAAAEPDPAGAGGAVLSGCTADGDRERPSGIFVRRGSRDTLCSAAAGPAAGCPHREPRCAAAGPVFAAGRGADAVQHIRGGIGLPLSGRGCPGPDERGRSLPDRCVPQSAGRRRRRSRWGCRCMAACSTWKWTPASSRWGS